MTSISPMELWKSTGITSYVCGQSAQRISESYYMLKHALDYQSPQVVLLETNMLFRYTNTPDSLRSSISDTAMYYFPVLQYHNLWKNIVNDQIPEGWQSYKGFAIRPGVAPYSKGSYMKKTKKEKEIPQINLWYLDKIRKLCEKNKIQLLLYTSASPVNHNYKRYNAVLKYAGKMCIRDRHPSVCMLHSRTSVRQSGIWKRNIRSSSSCGQRGEWFLPGKGSSLLRRRDGSFRKLKG